MIFEELANSNPIVNQLFMATKIDSQSIIDVPGATPVDFCYCDIECLYEELALAKIGGTGRQNDKTSFLFTKLIAADTITFKLFKSGTEIATITDNTYGEFFAAGTLANALYVGFIVDWEKVLTVEGAGLYEIKAETTIIGESKTFTSHKYRLIPYSDLAANGTIRIKAIQNGNIESNQLDYTGLEWEQMIRIKGKFFGKTPSLESDRYLDGQRKLSQIQDQINNSYTLETRLLPSEVANKIIYDLFLSNRIFVTDYNILNEDVENCEKTYTDIEVYPEEFEEPSHFSRITRRLYSFKFTDKKQNILKRNF